MSLLVAGSIAIDSIKTPFSQSDNLPGGSALYASIASSFFTRTKIVGIVGKDFKDKWIKILHERDIDTSGIKVGKGKTFHWKGEYKSFEKAISLDTKLNVFKNFRPELTKSQLKTEFVFLGNIDPLLQLNIINQLSKKSIIGIDTMDFWIRSKKELLIDVIGKSHILFVNESEIKLLSNKDNIFVAAEEIRKFFKGLIVIKRGSCGAIVIFNEKFFFLPAFPIKKIFDTTGAGDSFAGAFMGYLSKKGSLDFTVIKKALLYGVIISSFTIESFSFFKLLEISQEDINKRKVFLEESISL